jgi:hypothetical protein
MYRQLLLSISLVASVLAKTFPQAKHVPTMTIALFSPGPTPKGPTVEIGPDGSVAAKDPLIGTIAKGPKGSLISGPLGTVTKSPKRTVVSGPAGVAVVPAKVKAPAL